MPRLILNCEGAGLIMPEMGGAFVTMRRAPSNQTVVDHTSFSAQHALLPRTTNSSWLKDLNPTNGTWMNGDCVTDVELKDGDTIRFGSVSAIFAGVYRKRSSSRGIRKLWRSVLSQDGAQPIAVATAQGLSSL